MIKQAVVLTAILMITGMGAAQEISVSPNNFHEDIVAGEVIDKQLQVSWNGDTKTVVDMRADYATENQTVTSGFQTEFSPQEFIIRPGESKTVNATLETHSGLEPNKYFISFNAETETDLESETTREYIDRTDEVGEEYQGQLTSLEEDLNSTRSELEEAQSRLEELREIKAELERQGEDTDDITESILDKEDKITELQEDAESKQQKINSLQSDIDDLEEQNERLSTGLRAIGWLVGGMALLGMGIVASRRVDRSKFMEDLPGRWNQEGQEENK